MKYSSLQRFFSLVLILVVTSAADAQKKSLKITFDDVYRKRVFSAVGFPDCIQMNDGRHFALASGSRIFRYAYAGGEIKDVLFNLEDLGYAVSGPIQSFGFSAGDSRLLVTTNREQIYRHSYLADYHFHNLETGKSLHITSSGKVQLAEFSPDGNKVSYVRNNNLFIFDIETETEIQVTSDGEYNKIINGAPDWVYEEEFRFSRGYEWSPDSRYLAFYRTDESRVRMFSFNRYEKLYPEQIAYKYPKAGEDNSMVTIHVYDTESGKTRTMDTGEETDQYIPRIKWTRNAGILAITRLNRLQNRLDLILTNASDGEMKVILTEEEERYIVEPTDEKMVFLEDGERFLFMRELDGYLHYYLYDMDGNLLNQVTMGTWDVIEFLGLDERTETLFYTSHEESSLMSTVYSIRLDGTKKKKISGQHGWNTAGFSKGYDYFILTHSSATSPEKVSVHHRNGKLIRYLEENNALVESIRKYDLPEKELLTIDNGSGTQLNAYMYKPKDFDPGTAYPLIMFVYGGPESQSVRDEWGTSTWHYLLLEMGYVIVCVDNRGTNGRGEEFRKSTYMQLGKLELEDQLASARFLGTLPYIDSRRIGIWGSSYGGYMAALCITLGSDVFKLAISNSPVTSWRYYDTIYTERFLRTSLENPQGYDDYSPLHHADSLKGEFLLTHGMVDDNVHFQNSVDFVQALIMAGKDFETMFYPDQTHSIHRMAGLHLRQLMTRFVLENL